MPPFLLVVVKILSAVEGARNLRTQAWHPAVYVVEFVESAEEIPGAHSILRVTRLIIALANKLILRPLEMPKEQLDLIPHIVQLQPLNHDVLSALLQMRQQYFLLLLSLALEVGFAAVETD